MHMHHQLDCIYCTTTNLVYTFSGIQHGVMYI